MRNKLILFLCLLLLAGCKNPEKPQVKDYSYLKIQTELSEEDKKYYEDVHQKINKIGKEILFNHKTKLDMTCQELKTMFQEISDRPFSKEREREREREKALIYDNCQVTAEELGTIFTCDEAEYLNLREPSSGIIFGRLKDCITLNKASYENDPDKVQALEMKHHYYEKLSQIVDPIDLEGFRGSFLDLSGEARKEYCRKAVSQRQWDHIAYFVSNSLPGEDMIKCLNKNDPEYKECMCPEAVNLYVKEASRAQLLDGSRLVRSYTEGYPKEIAKRFIKAVKDSTGRDLDKEPKTEFIYEPCSN
jgi:hypothetical protein